MTVLVLLFAYFAVGLILDYRNRLRAPLFQVAASMLIVLLWPIYLFHEIVKLWSPNRFRVGFAAYDPEQPSRKEIPQNIFFASWAEAIVHAKELAHSDGRKVTIRDEARYDKGLSGYLPQYVTLAPGGEVIDASSSQIYQKYMNESAWHSPVSEPVATSTNEEGAQALGEGNYATALKAFRTSAEDEEPYSPEAMSATAFSEAPSRPLLSSNYFVRHWRGELSLGTSYWLNSNLAGIVTMALLAAYDSTAAKDSHSLRVLSFAAIGSLLLPAPIWVWSSVGIWRSANHYVTRGGSSRWASMARVMVVLGSFSVMGQLTSTILPQLKEYALIATGNDPVGAINIKVATNGQSVIVDGSLREGSAVEVQKILDAAPGATFVVLNSAGGRSGEAQQLAHVVRSRQLNTYVENECASACTFVFLAGKDRAATPDARLGFHQPSFPGLDADAQRAATERMLNAYRAAGLPEAFLQRIAKTPPNDMWFPTTNELTAAHIITHLWVGDEEWLWMDNDKPGMTIYVNPDTITRKGQLATMWELFDFEYPEHVADTSHLSFKMHSEYNCTEGHKRELAMKSFSGNMGRGNVVRSYSPEGTWEPVTPGSVNHDLWEFACGKERLQAQFHPVEGEAG